MQFTRRPSRSSSVQSQVAVGPVSRPIRTAPGAFDLTNPAVASGVESTTLSRTTDPVWFTTQINVCFNDTSNPNIVFHCSSPSSPGHMKLASIPGELIPCALVWLDPGITPCCKTLFVSPITDFPGRGRGNQILMWGTTLFCDELTDDFGDAFEAIDRRLPPVLSFSGNFATQRFGTFATQSPRAADIRADIAQGPRRTTSGHATQQTPRTAAGMQQVRQLSRADPCSRPTLDQRRNARSVPKAEVSCPQVHHASRGGRAAVD
jgi:hypothetical protein